ncbi:uncharacterized protein At5g19025-like [Chenopodium quinoa]|uniref:uncharacterized protein At5g19025-like n=1 Tax=Chenopodium quinoa TaxID=63459 RepID=UPI000B77FAFE|nr:uncharacterized protein At5g19025-like [Chenopodium quinoa]
MRHHLHPHPIFSLLTSFPTTITTMPPSSSSSPLSKPRKPSSSSAVNHHSSTLFCRHHSPSATATLDLLILILVLFSGTFLLTSYFSYIFNSLSLLLPPLFISHSSLLHQFPLIYLLGFLLSFALVAVSFEICCCGGFGFGFRSRKCHNPKCKGLKKALEFDLQLQIEDCLKSGPNDIDKLPWKGGTESNPDYECLRAELRKMAPPNGRAVLLFRAKCGCPIAKLIGWGPKKGRKHKKALSNLAANGDHR